MREGNIWKKDNSEKGKLKKDKSENGTAGK